MRCLLRTHHVLRFILVIQHAWLGLDLCCSTVSGWLWMGDWMVCESFKCCSEEKTATRRTPFINLSLSVDLPCIQSFTLTDMLVIVYPHAYTYARRCLQICMKCQMYSLKNYTLCTRAFLYTLIHSSLGFHCNFLLLFVDASYWCWL